MWSMNTIMSMLKRHCIFLKPKILSFSFLGECWRQTQLTVSLNSLDSHLKCSQSYCWTLQSCLSLLQGGGSETSADPIAVGFQRSLHSRPSNDVPENMKYNVYLALLESQTQPGMVPYAFNSSVQEAEAGGYNKFKHRQGYTTRLYLKQTKHKDLLTSVTCFLALNFRLLPFLSLFSLSLDFFWLCHVRELYKVLHFLCQGTVDNNACLTKW